MESWLVALIAAAGAIAGSGLTGVITYRLARLERDSAANADLRTALAAYGAAPDRLTMQIEQLLQAHGIEEDWTTAMIAKLRTLDWLVGRVSTATIGRGAMRAIDEVIAATKSADPCRPGVGFGGDATGQRIDRRLRPCGGELERRMARSASRFLQGVKRSRRLVGEVTGNEKRAPIYGRFLAP
jgi:hypothetical protein